MQPGTALKGGKGLECRWIQGPSAPKHQEKERVPLFPPSLWPVISDKHTMQKSTQIIHQIYQRLAGKNNVTGWEYIRRIRRSPAFGSLIFYPLVASLLTLSGNMQNILFLPFPLEVSTRVHLLYWSLLFLFLGTALYAMFCPGMFVRYDTHLDYANAEIKVLVIPIFCKNTIGFVNLRLCQHRDQVNKFRPDIVDRLEKAINAVESQIKSCPDSLISDNVVAEMMLTHWKFMNRVRPEIRVAIFVFYCLGIGLIAIISAISVFDVLRSYFG